MSLLANAIALLPAFGSQALHVHYLQQPALLGAMLSQRARARASTQRRYCSSQRLLLLGCGSWLCALAISMASALGRYGSIGNLNGAVAIIMKRNLSVVALRLWEEAFQAAASSSSARGKTR